MLLDSCTLFQSISPLLDDLILYFSISPQTLNSPHSQLTLSTISLKKNGVISRWFPQAPSLYLPIYSAFSSITMAELPLLLAKGKPVNSCIKSHSSNPSPYLWHHQFQPFYWYHSQSIYSLYLIFQLLFPFSLVSSPLQTFTIPILQNCSSRVVTRYFQVIISK